MPVRGLRNLESFQLVSPRIFDPGILMRINFIFVAHCWELIFYSGAAHGQWTSSSLQNLFLAIFFRAMQCMWPLCPGRGDYQLYPQMAVATLLGLYCPKSIVCRDFYNNKKMPKKTNKQAFFKTIPVIDLSSKRHSWPHSMIRNNLKGAPFSNSPFGYTLHNK